MTSMPSAAALEAAQRALDDVAPAGGVGHVLDTIDEHEGVLSVRYASLLAGYPDWRWTVTLSTDVEGGPSVLEVALLPGETSLLSPAWVPWADRLADYLAAKEAAGEADDDELESDLEADLDDDFDDDYDDVDEDGDGIGDHEIDEAEVPDEEADGEAAEGDSDDR